MTKIGWALNEWINSTQNKNVVFLQKEKYGVNEIEQSVNQFEG